MTDFEYKLTQDRLMALTKLTLALDLDAFLNQTAYREGAKNPGKIKDIAIAARKLQRAGMAVLMDK